VLQVSLEAGRRALIAKNTGSRVWLPPRDFPHVDDRGTGRL